MARKEPPIPTIDRLSRRELIRFLGAAGAASVLRPLSAWALPGQVGAPPGPLLTRRIPSSGEELPLVGLGSWITFNVGEDRAARDSCADVMSAFFQGGGRLIDSSPMYGSSQDVIGYGLKKLGSSARVFSADKVWESRGASGPSQVE